MELNRRTLLTSSLASAAALAVPVRAAEAEPEATRLFEVAKREHERLGRKIWLRDKAGIADFSLPSSQPRFFLLDLVSGQVKPYFVTHGKGSDPEHDGWLKQFSNVDGSAATSRGGYVTHTWYSGKHGPSMRLSGLDDDNSNAEARAIVVHGAAYANPEHLAKFGKLGRSDGCFAFPEARLMEILAYLGPGRMIFADKLSPIQPATSPVDHLR